jgi:hypothetical protein
MATYLTNQGTPVNDPINQATASERAVSKSFLPPESVQVGNAFMLTSEMDVASVKVELIPWEEPPEYATLNTSRKRTCGYSVRGFENSH